MAAKPYKGNDNYIFISYAHKDIEEVLSFIERLQAEGFNVWFDEGIDPGTEWDDNIASHIEGCSFFVAFITENFLHSQNCRDELSFARDLEKERLLIYGEDVELPRGMQMRLNRLQAIYKHRYANEDEFYSKVFETNGINTCQTADKDTTVTIKPATINDSEVKAVTTDDTVVLDNTVDLSKPVTSDKRTGNSKGKIIIAIIAVAVLAIAGVIFGLSRNGSGDTIQDEDLKASKTVTINQIPADIISDGNLRVTLDSATYTTGASDITFNMESDNATGDPLYIVLSDVVIDDVPVHVDFDGREDALEDGGWTFSRDVYLEDIMDAGVTEFKNFSCSMTVVLDGKALQKTDLKLSRDAFSDEQVELTGSKVDNSTKTIKISKKNLAPVIAANDKYSIAMNSCEYAKDAYAGIYLEVKNNTKELMDIYMEDLKVDDSTITASRDDSPIQVGETYYNLTVDLEDLKAAGVEEFKEMSFTMVVKVGDKESLRQKIHITRDVFVEE